MKYDYLIVGSGLFGSVFANIAKQNNKNVLVVEKRDHLAGNIFTDEIEGIPVHKYGAHIFHTSNAQVWRYVNRFTSFNNFVNSPIAVYKGRLYNLPFNMNTFYSMWGVKHQPRHWPRSRNSEQWQVLESRRISKNRLSVS